MKKKEKKIKTERIWGYRFRQTLVKEGDLLPAAYGERIESVEVEPGGYMRVVFSQWTFKDLA